MVVDIEELKRLNKKAGQFWFDADTTRFFKSRYSQTAEKVGNKAYFITSEQFDLTSPRLYSIRVFDYATSGVNTIGEFQDYKTHSQAGGALKLILNKERR